MSDIYVEGKSLPVIEWEKNNCWLSCLICFVFSIFEPKFYACVLDFETLSYSKENVNTLKAVVLNAIDMFGLPDKEFLEFSITSGFVARFWNRHILASYGEQVYNMLVKEVNVGVPYGELACIGDFAKEFLKTYKIDTHQYIVGEFNFPKTDFVKIYEYETPHIPTGAECYIGIYGGHYIFFNTKGHNNVLDAPECDPKKYIPHIQYYRV